MEYEQHNQTRPLENQVKWNEKVSLRWFMKEIGAQIETYFHPESARNSLYWAVGTLEQRGKWQQVERTKSTVEYLGLLLALQLRLFMRIPSCYLYLSAGTWLTFRKESDNTPKICGKYETKKFEGKDPGICCSSGKFRIKLLEYSPRPLNLFFSDTTHEPQRFLQIIREYNFKII